MSQGRRTFLFIVLLVFCFVFFSNVSVAETLNESDSEQIALSYLSEQSGIDSTFIQKMFVISHVFQGSNDKHERCIVYLRYCDPVDDIYWGQRRINWADVDALSSIIPSVQITIYDDNTCSSENDLQMLSEKIYQYRSYITHAVEIIKVSRQWEAEYGNWLFWSPGMKCSFQKLYHAYPYQIEYDPSRDVLFMVPSEKDFSVVDVRRIGEKCLEAMKSDQFPITDYYDTPSISLVKVDGKKEWWIRYYYVFNDGFPTNYLNDGYYVLSTAITIDAEASDGHIGTYVEYDLRGFPIKIIDIETLS